MPVDEAGVGKFIEMAKQSGVVSIDDLRRAFPIDTMGGEDIAAIVLRLEDAGVSVEIDPSLFASRHDPSTNPFGNAGTHPSPAHKSTGPTSRASPGFQEPGPGVSPLPESKSGYSRVDSSVVSSGRTRLILWMTLLLVIAAVAIWGLSKV